MPDGPDYCERHAEFRPVEGESQWKALLRTGDQGKGGRYSGRKRTGSPQPEIEGPEKTTKKKKPEGFDMLRYFQRKPDKDDDGRPPPGHFDSYEGDGGGAGMGGLLA